MTTRPEAAGASRPKLPHGVLRLRWLGQAGFVIHTADVSALIDPWLSPHELRIRPPAVVTELPDALDWILVTHEHEDHLDIPLIRDLVARRPTLRIVIPTPLAARVSEHVPFARIVPVQPGDQLDQEGLRLNVVPAIHGVSVPDGYSAGPQGKPTPYVGYVLRLGQITVYHAGDTILSESLIKTLSSMGIDVALLPINGRDFFRESAGVLGNLNADEAVQLASVIGARLLVPMHYDMVRGNTSSAGAVVASVTELDAPIHVLIPSRHEPVDVHLERPT